MAVLENIRTKFGLAISIIIALALLSFIIDPSTVENAVAAMSSKNDVGNINGKSVSQEDFQVAEENFNQVYQFQTGSQASSEQERKQVRDMAWNSLLYRYLFIPTAEKAGLKVSTDEMADLTSGDRILPIFQSMFAGDDGNFSRENMVRFLEELDEQGHEGQKVYWNVLQEEVKTQQYQSKYMALFGASDAVSPLRARNLVKANNETASIEFVSVPYDLGMYGEKDSTIVVSDAEVKAYYNDHKKLYDQPASRDIEYVVFEVNPSASDIEAKKEEMDQAYAQFTTTDNLKAFLSYSNNTEMRWSERWYKDGDLNSVCRDVNKFVFEDGKGFSPIYRDGNAWYAAKVVAEKQMPESVTIEYIVLADGEGAAQLADSLATRVRAGDDFQTLVTLYSANKREYTTTFNQPDDAPAFAQVFSAPVGQTSVIAANGGQFVVRVKEKGANALRKQVAILKKSATASDNTFKDKYAEAAEFAALAAGSYDNYRKAVDSLSRKYALWSQPMSVREDTDTYGSIGSAKELTRWVFGAKVGKVSDIVTVENKYYFIATVKEIHKEGTPTLKEVSDDIRNLLYAQKSGAAKAAEVAEKIKGLTDMEAIAKALDVTVSKQENVRFGAADRSTDPALVGAVAATAEGAISRPVIGAMPFVYVVKVASRDTDAHFTDDDARAEHLRKNQMAAGGLLSVMSQDAAVKDNRARFF